jgi:hypothetical protein
MSNVTGRRYDGNKALPWLARLVRWEYCEQCKQQNQMANNPTIIVSKGGVSYKLCKVWFGTDGSYYVAVPYHPARKALFMKMTVDYTVAGPQWKRHSDALEVAILDDEDARPKLSHHPDGFCHFSGPGVLSGKHEDGSIKGIGVFTSPLMKVGRGPVFSLIIQGIEAFDRQEKARVGDLMFVQENLSATNDMTGLALEAYYFQPLHRRFIRTSTDGNKYISVVHPSGIVLPLRVVMTPDNCELPGFLGLELYAVQTGFSEPTFTLSGPGEKPRKDEYGHVNADVIMSVFPAPENAAYRRDISFKAPQSPAE